MRNPWNLDHTRILLAEATDFTHPDYKVTGRRLVWGFIDDLRKWRTLEEYQAAAKKVPYGDEFEIHMDWSPFPGEENILYGLHRPTKQVAKINVDTGEVTFIISYDPGDGTDVSKAQNLGWTTDNHLIVNFNRESWGSGGYEIDVISKTRKRYKEQPDYCSEEGRRWPMRGHGHGALSPDRTMLVSYSSSNYAVLKDNINCEIIDYFTKTYPPTDLTHVSWKASNDWFIGNDYGLKRFPVPEKPSIDTYSVYQQWIDGTRIKLFSQETASHWCNPDLMNCPSERVSNWTAHFIVTLRDDGKQALFTSTNGKFTYEDFKLYGAEPWGTEGFFLAEFEYEYEVVNNNNNNDDIPPAAPQSLVVE